MGIPCPSGRALIVNVCGHYDATTVLDHLLEVPAEVYFA